MSAPLIVGGGYMVVDRHGLPVGRQGQPLLFPFADERVELNAHRHAQQWCEYENACGSGYRVARYSVDRFVVVSS